jgi:hypothetical protein
MDLDINALARRVPGPRLLVYLDQSTLSSLVRDESHAGLLDLLKREVQAGRIICPSSDAHDDESALVGDRELWKAVDSLTDELAIGVAFRSNEEIEYAEIYAAAAEFSGQDSDVSGKEAFRTDPQTSREKLFMSFGDGQIRIRAYFEPNDMHRGEVEYERNIEDGMEQAYAELREAGFSFEEMAVGNLEQMISWKLGPLLAPEEFAQHYFTRAGALARAIEAGSTEFTSGSAYSRFQAFGMRKAQIERLAARYPDIQRKPSEFRQFKPLRTLPTLAYPALFRAALAAMPKRRAKASDGYDIGHLTLGLSRCDFVTADGGMAQLVRDFRLVPDGCEVFAHREADQLVDAIERRLRASASPQA